MVINFKSLVKILAVLSLVVLASCGGIFDPKGYIAGEQKKLIYITFFIMVGVAIPVFIMAFVFAYRYSEKRVNANYQPNWDHNTKLEIVIWGIPVAIIVYLATLAWGTAHSLDPKKSIDSSISTNKEIVIQAISLDWKWLFVYPEYGIATVNYIEFPVDTPVKFQITSDTAMNALWIPQLAGMIYSMAAMETNLNVIADTKGVYNGVSSSYSGFGFSGMQFKANVVSNQDFNAWVESVKSSNLTLNANTYVELAKPTDYHPVTLMKLEDNKLFYKVIAKYITNDVDASVLHD